MHAYPKEVEIPARLNRRMRSSRSRSCQRHTGRQLRGVRSRVATLLQAYLLLSISWVAPGARSEGSTTSQTKTSTGPQFFSSKQSEERTISPASTFFNSATSPAPDLSEQVSEYVREMFEDSKGDLWFGTMAGVIRYDGKTLTDFTGNAGFPANEIRGIVEDENNHLWFATEAGVVRFDRQRFTLFTTQDGLSHNNVWSIARDRKGKLWIGTVGGVSTYDGKTFTRFPIPPSRVVADSRFSRDLVWAIHEDRQGTLWFGTDGAGLTKYNGTTFVTYTSNDGLASNHILSILEDQKGTLWFGTREGNVLHYEGSVFSTLPPKDRSSGKEISTLYEEKSGALWFGTSGGGVSRYDRKTMKSFTSKDGLTNPFVQSILEDRNGNLWFGTSGGLFRFDGKSFRNITRKQLQQ